MSTSVSIPSTFCIKQTSATTWASSPHRSSEGRTPPRPAARCSSACKFIFRKAGIHGGHRSDESALSRKERNREGRKEQRGRHDEQPCLQKLPSADVLALAAQGDQPQNGCQGSSNGQIGTEVHSDQDRIANVRRYVYGF